MEEAQDKFIEQLFREDYSMLLTYAYSALLSEQLAEEAVQEAFRIACRKIDSVMQSRNPHGWMMNTLKNVLRTTKRNRVKMAALLVATVSASELMQLHYNLEIDIDVLYGDIAKSKEYRLIKKVAIDQKTMLEVAEEEGITLEACKKRVQRARKKLQKRLEDNLN